MVKGIKKLFVDEVLSANKGLTLLMFIILYTSFDTLVFGTLDMPIMRTAHDIGHIVMGLVCAVIIFAKQRKLAPLIVICAWILLTCVVNGDFGGGNILLIIVFVISYCVASTVPIKKYIEIYEHLFFYLVLINLILYILYSINPSLFSFLPAADNIVGGNYRIAFFSVFREGALVQRNMAFFREPGVYMMYLNVAIIINLFSYKKPVLRNLIVYILAMITTMSTAGYVILMLILFVYFALKKSKVGVFVILVSAMLLAFSYNYISNMDIYVDTIGKFNTTSDKYVSAEARYASTTAPLYIMLHNPVTGTGLGMFTSEFESYANRVYHMSYTREGTATNTLLNLGAIYGVFMLLLLLYYLMNFVKRINSAKSLIITALLIIAFLMMLSNEEVYYTVFFMTLIMYGATKQKTTTRHGVIK